MKALDLCMSKLLKALIARTKLLDQIMNVTGLNYEFERFRFVAMYMAQCNSSILAVKYPVTSTLVTQDTKFKSQKFWQTAVNFLFQRPSDVDLNILF